MNAVKLAMRPQAMKATIWWTMLLSTLITLFPQRLNHQHLLSDGLSTTKRWIEYRWISMNVVPSGHPTRRPRVTPAVRPAPVRADVPRNRTWSPVVEWNPIRRSLKSAQSVWSVCSFLRHATMQLRVECARVTTTLMAPTTMRSRTITTRTRTKVSMRVLNHDHSMITHARLVVASDVRIQSRKSSKGWTEMAVR